ncbi:MAG: carbohydrate ABC transporter permease [Chloroflexota bacterium]|nr:carbohydrate ABC transporter permease [Chloroflexota bacterium]
MALVGRLNQRLEPRRGVHRSRPLSPARAGVYTVLVLGAAASVLPFVYMLLTSVKSYGNIVNNTLWPWPPFGTDSVQLQNYALAVQAVGFDRQTGTPLLLRYAANSIVVSLGIVLGSLLTSVLAAYALARLNVPGKNLLFLFVLAVIMVPEDATLVPKVVMMYNLKWYNTYPALIVPFTVNVFGIFLLRQWFLQIPKELFEAALMDGMGHIRYLISIVIPLSKPALLTVALLSFIWSWDSFKWPLLVTRDSSMRVLGVGLQQFKTGEGGTNVQLMMAFATLVVLPVIVFYFLTQKQFREAVTTVGIKG